MSVVAIGVTHNRYAMLQQCVPHLEAQTYSCDLWVVDNVFENSTCEWLQNHQKINPHMHIYHLDRNTGGAGGFHREIAESLRHDYDYLWPMNDDCMPEPDALAKLMEADQLQKLGRLSASIFSVSSTIRRLNMLPHERNKDLL